MINFINNMLQRTKKYTLWDFSALKVALVAVGEVVIDGFRLLDILLFGVFDAAVEHQAGGERLAARLYNCRFA